MLSEYNEKELAEWFAYLNKDDELFIDKLSYAIAKAFSKREAIVDSSFDDEDEEVIDTTTEEFAEHFKGFTNASQRMRRFQQPDQGTQILFG